MRIVLGDERKEAGREIVLLACVWAGRLTGMGGGRWGVSWEEVNCNIVICGWRNMRPEETCRLKKKILPMLKIRNFYR